MSTVVSFRQCAKCHREVKQPEINPDFCGYHRPQFSARTKERAVNKEPRAPRYTHTTQVASTPRTTQRDLEQLKQRILDAQAAYKKLYGEHPASVARFIELLLKSSS